MVASLEDLMRSRKCCSQDTGKWGCKDVSKSRSLQSVSEALFCKGNHEHELWGEAEKNDLVVIQEVTILPFLRMRWEWEWGEGRESEFSSLMSEESGSVICKRWNMEEKGRNSLVECSVLEELGCGHEEPLLRVWCSILHLSEDSNDK